MHEYSQAVRAGDYERAYAMMSAPFRARHSRDEYIRTMQRNRAEARETVTRLDRAAPSVEVVATYHYGLADELRLVLEDGRWKIATDPIAFYSQETPRDALRSFIRAYRLRRWDVMLRLVPKLYADKMDLAKVERQFEGPHRDEIEIMMSALEANLLAPIERHGLEARMPYADTEVVFVREGAAWKIKDPG